MQRSSSDEEIRAVTWKCRLQKSSPEFIQEMPIRLPAACIQQALEDYRNHASVVALKGTPVKMTFLVSRDL